MDATIGSLVPQQLVGIDLRSDTITRPGEGMRMAMARALVGDDVFGEDPTVNKLEAKVAALLGKPAALFMASGVMANQTAIHCHTRPGDEVLCAETAHVYVYESGAPAMLSGVNLKVIDTKGTGIFTGLQVALTLRPTNIHFATTSLVCVENTSNLGGGAVWPLEALKSVSEQCKASKLKLHMDGARLWNASVASGIPLATYASLCDSVSVCLSKGLGAPVGSILVGEPDFIAQARRFRKAIGGGMRQVGILAAAGIYAIDNNFERLAVDHSNAQKFYHGLKEIGVLVDPNPPETNIIYFRVSPFTTEQFASQMSRKGLLLNSYGNRLRAVFSLEVTPSQVDEALRLIGEYYRGEASP